MKMEEVDLVSIKEILKKSAEGYQTLGPTVEAIMLMERNVVTELQFKLLPDTLYFWLDLQVRLWDLFVDHEDMTKQDCCRFKPPTDNKSTHLSRYDAT